MELIRTTCLCFFVVICSWQKVLSQRATHDSSEVRSIEIAPQWDGLGQPSRTAVIIRNVKGVFRRTGHDSDSSAQSLEGDVINEDLVRDLLHALREPVVSAPEMTNLRISKEWLQRMWRNRPSTREHSGK
jgi:hypothetical protein